MRQQIKDVQHGENIIKILMPLVRDRALTAVFVGPCDYVTVSQNQSIHDMHAYENNIAVYCNARTAPTQADEVAILPDERSIRFWATNGYGERLQFIFAVDKQQVDWEEFNKAKVALEEIHI